GGGADRGGFRKNNLRIAVIGRDIVFVTAIARINQKVEAAVIVLHLREEIRFPLCLLQNIALAVAALGQAEIVEIADAGKIVGGEDEQVNEVRAVLGVFAVIARIVVAVADIDGTWIHEGIKAGGNILHRRRGVAWVFPGVG